MKFLLLFLLIAPLAAFAQNAKIDSLKRVIETTKVDTVKGRTLCRLCVELRKYGKAADALHAGNQGLEISRKKKDHKSIASCLNNIGNIHVSQGEISRALAYYQQSLKIDEEIGNQAGSANSLHNIGNIYESKGDYPRALEFYQRSLKIYDEIGSLKGVASSLNNIGLIYWGQGELSRALDHYRRSLKIEEELGNKEGVAASLSNIGNIYGSQGDHARARECFERSLKIQEETGDQAGAAGSLGNMGIVYGNQGDHVRAIQCYRRSLKIFEELGDPVGITFSNTNMAFACLNLGKPDSARFFARMALHLAREVGLMEHKLGGAQVLYQCDSVLGDWKSAFEAHRLYKMYSDSLKNDEQSKEIGRLEAEYEAEKMREGLVANQQAQLERYNWVIGSSVTGLLLMMTLALTFLRGRQKEKRANAALRALNEQISQQKAEIEAQNTEIVSINTELQVTLDQVNRQSHQLAETNEQLAEKNLRLKLAQELLVLEQDSREQAQRMAGIGEISSIIAHEVNTPLGAIKAGAQNLIDRLAQGAVRPELRPLIERAAQAQPLSSREERAALRKLEAICQDAGFSKPEEAARQLVNCGLHDLEDAETLGLLAREPELLAQLTNTGAFMAQAANIQRAAERAANIVSALKTYSTLAGGPGDENAGASVADTLGLVLKLYDYYLSQGIELKIDPMDGLPSVSLDPGALSQVWTKLLLNSIYGMNRKGKLEIKFIVTDRHLKILWLDDGPSPSNEAMARAFEPGVALRETDPPIDLWLCCAFVEGEAGGRIMASIPADGGLVIELLLPKAD